VGLTQQKLEEFKLQGTGSNKPQAAWSLALAQGEMATGDASYAAALFDENLSHNCLSRIAIVAS
jgi:hypothetical protein